MITPLFAVEAEELLAIGKANEAIDLCIDGLKEYPHYISAHGVLARAYELIGDNEHSKGVINELQSKFPNNKISRKLADFSEKGKISEYIDIKPQTLINNSKKSKLTKPKVKPNVKETKKLEIGKITHTISKSDLDEMQLGIRWNAITNSVMEFPKQEFVVYSRDNYFSFNNILPEFQLPKVKRKKSIVKEDVIEDRLNNVSNDDISTLDEKEDELYNVLPEIYSDEILESFDDEIDISLNNSADLSNADVSHLESNTKQFELDTEELFLDDEENIGFVNEPEREIFQEIISATKNLPNKISVEDLSHQLEDFEFSGDESEEEEDYTDFATETLAEIYIEQGAIKSAIKIYETLIINEPTKAEYFSNKILELKQSKK
jgi:tetratricopeptide (TPR) repeat protein